MSITHNLKTIRSKYRMSQEAFGELLGVSRSMINNYESGQSSPQIDFLLRLSELIGISIDRVFYQEIQDEELPADLKRGMVQDPSVGYSRKRNLFDVRDLIREVEDLRKEINEIKKRGM